MVKIRLDGLKFGMAIYRSIFLLVCSVLLLNGCLQDDSLPVKPHLEGVETELREFLHSRYQEAVDSLESGMARGNLAMAYDANGFYAEAISTYEEAAFLSPEEFRWPYYMGIVQSEIGDLQAAIQSVDLALNIDPLYAPGLLRKSVWLVYEREFERADQSLQILLESDIPIHLRSIGNMARGRALIGMNDPQKAIELLEPLLGGMFDSQVRHPLRTAYRQVGRTADLKALGQSVAEVKYDWPDQRRDQIFASVRGSSGELKIAETLLSTGQVDRALTLLKKLRQIKPEDPSILNNLATAYVRKNQMNEAFQIYNEAIDIHGDYFLLHFNLGTAYELSGDRERALNHFDRVLELRPTMSRALQRRAMLLSDLGRHDEALTAIEEAIMAGAGTAQMSFYAGLIKGSQGKWLEAVREFETAINIDPRMVRSYLFLGHALIELNRFDEAARAFSMAESYDAKRADISSARKRLSLLGFDFKE